MAELDPKPLPSPSRRRRLLRGAAEVALFLALFGAVRAWQHRDAPSGQAPEVTGALVSSGAPASLSALRGRPVLVHFWATWCSVCTAERGNVDAVARDHAVLAVASDSGEAAEVRAWMQKQGVSFPSVLDGGALARAWGVRAFPTTYVVDGDGRIRFVETGYTTELGLRARLWLAGL